MSHYDTGMSLVDAAFRLPMPAFMSMATRLPSHVVVGTTPRVMASIRRRPVNLVVWQRAPSALLHEAATALAEHDLRVDIELDDPAPHLLAALLPARVGSGVRDVIARDVSDLCMRFARQTGVQRLRLKLETVATDECRLFHVDHVRWRLVTTWIGPGTDWVENDACRREHLGGRGLVGRPPPDEVNAAIVADWTRVHRLDRCSVALCRGLQAATAAVPALVHRSPPIGGTGLRRLRLVIDPVLDDDHEHGPSCG